MRRLNPKALAMLALAAAIGVLSASWAGAQALTPVLETATPQGVGGLRLGMTIKALQEKKLIGPARKGCELAIGERAAPLKAPLQGFATFWPKNRLFTITLSGGAATPAGIGIGATIPEARAAYPNASYEPPHPRDPIPVGLIFIGGEKNPKMTLVINPASRLVSEIAIPSPDFCE